MKDFILNNVKTTGDLTRIIGSNGKSIATNVGRFYVNGNFIAKNCDFGQKAYNGLFIADDGGGVNPRYSIKNALFENCNFSGTITNNGITICNIEDGGTITLKNCHFASCSNCLRLLNNKASKNITINLINCTCNHWEDSNSGYNGFLIFEDPTSKNEEVVLNRYGPENVTINFINCYYPDGRKIKPADPSEICYRKMVVEDPSLTDEERDELQKQMQIAQQKDQVVYVYRYKGGLMDYDPTIYPKMTFA